MANCRRCHRELKDPESVKSGIGPVCRGKSRENQSDGGDDTGMAVDLPFDAGTWDVVCERRPTGRNDLSGQPMTRVHVNVPQAVVSHSPDGFEWGYGGSGPADFALNILHLFVPAGADGFAPVKCFQGETSSTSWTLHQEFKVDFIARLPREGGVITGDAIRSWLGARKASVNCYGCCSNPCQCVCFGD